jgi:hypothetical protein
MSDSTSPTIPDEVSLRDVPTLDAPAIAAAVNLDHATLIKVVTDLVTQKPTSVAEALKLMGTLQEKIAEWALSELPEKDKILAGLKVAETVAASVGCLPCFRK